jgi:hypothetical protein
MLELKRKTIEVRSGDLGGHGWGLPWSVHRPGTVYIQLEATQCVILETKLLNKLENNVLVTLSVETITAFVG